MRHHKFPTVLLLTPEEGLANDCQSALRNFGLRKLTVVSDLAEFEKHINEIPFHLIMIDTDCLLETEQTNLVSEIRDSKGYGKGIIVAISHIQSRDELFALREQGYSSVLFKPISVGMVEQALSEVIERERNQPVDRESLRQVYSLFLLGGAFEAERTLSIWLEKEPESLEGLTLLGLQQLKKQEFYRCYATIKKVLALKSDYLPALQLKTRVSLRLGKISEAYQSLAQEEKTIALLDAKRVHGPAHTLSASEQAEVSFCAEFKTREGMTALLNNLALQLSKTGRYDEALVLYRKAMGPLEDPEAKFIGLFNRGRLYLNLKKRAEAKKDFIEARRLSPEELHPKIDELLGLCDRQDQQAEEMRSRDTLKRQGASASAPTDDQTNNANQTQQTNYRTFNSEEVLELVFLGKMEESTVPPESLAEWLQMKRKLMHILFLNDLPIPELQNADPQLKSEQGAP